MEDILIYIGNGVVELGRYLLANDTTILAYLAGGAGVSALLQLFKKLRKWESKAWIQTVLAIFSGLAATADYVINNYATSAMPTIFGDMAPKILVAALLMHRVAVNPLTKVAEKAIKNYISTRAEKVADSVVVTGHITPVSPSETAVPAQFDLP